jgi:hypothetical protein
MAVSVREALGLMSVEIWGVILIENCDKMGRDVRKI